MKHLLSFAIAITSFSSGAIAHIELDTIATLATVTITALAKRATATCSAVSIATPQPSGTICGTLSNSDGTKAIISYTTGVYVSSILACGQICLATSGCTNLYFTLNQYCNLKSGTPTNAANTNSPFSFYNAACFACAMTTSTSSSTKSSISTSHVRGFTSNTLASTSVTATTRGTTLTTKTTSATPTSCTAATVSFRLSGATASSADGEIVHIAGSTPELGAWVFANSVSVSLVGALWEASVAFALGEYAEYKYYWVASNGTVVWSSEPNYILSAPASCVTALVVQDTWR